jgi:hypothetical protein
VPGCYPSDRRASSTNRTHIVEFDSDSITDRTLSPTSKGRTGVFEYRFPVGGRVVRSQAIVTSPGAMDGRRKATSDDFTVRLVFNETPLTMRVRNHDGRQLPPDNFIELTGLSRGWTDAHVAEGDKLDVTYWMSEHALGACAPARIVLRFEIVGDPQR